MGLAVMDRESDHKCGISVHMKDRFSPQKKMDQSKLLKDQNKLS